MMAPLRYALHRHRYPVRYAHLTTLLANQAQTRSELLVQQQRALTSLIAHARSHVRYYAETLAQVPPGRIELAALPILRKQTVRQRLDDLLARDAEGQPLTTHDAKLGHTGGSTGTPLAFWYDEAKHELMRAGMMRSYMLCGWRPGERILNLWGARQDVAPGGVFGSRWDDFISAERTVPAVEYDEAQLQAWVLRIRRERPVLIQGYASILGAIARVALATGAAMPSSLRGVFSTAEVLTPELRQRMERAFGCKVFNQYGSREVPNIACECRLGNMHVFTDMVMLESVASATEPSAPSALLVTSLTNRLMPMIRYDIGDSGRLIDGACDCGLAFPLMEMSLCRHNDLIRTASGKTVHPSYFNRVLQGRSEIAQYQWTQQALDHMHLKLVAAQPLGPEVAAALATQLRRDVDAGMQLSIAYCDAIPRTQAGKHRYVIGL